MATMAGAGLGFCLVGLCCLLTSDTYMISQSSFGKHSESSYDICLYCFFLQHNNDTLNYLLFLLFKIILCCISCLDL